MRCLWFWGDFGQPVSWSSGLCSFVAGEFACYVFPWNLLDLVWCLVSVSVWRRLMSSQSLVYEDSRISSSDVGNLISGSCVFSKTIWNIRKFTVHILLKPGLENFEHYFPRVWDECNCVVVWAFFGIAFLWDENENWPFPVLWPLLSFPNLLAYWEQHFHSLIFQDLKAEVYFDYYNSYSMEMNMRSSSYLLEIDFPFWSTTISSK